MTSPIGRRSIVHQCAECCDPTSSPNCNSRLCNFNGMHFFHWNDKHSSKQELWLYSFSTGFCRVCYGVHQDASSCPLSKCADDEVEIQIYDRKLISSRENSTEMKKKCAILGSHCNFTFYYFDFRCDKIWVSKLYLRIL